MLSRVPRDTSRQNLPALRDVLTQARDVFVVDFGDLFRAERADLTLGAPLFFRGSPFLGIAGHRSLPVLPAGGACRWNRRGGAGSSPLALHTWRARHEPDVR